MAIDDTDFKTLETRLGERYILVRKDLVKVWVAAGAFVLTALGVGGYWGIATIGREAAVKYLQTEAGLGAKAAVDAQLGLAKSAAEETKKNLAAVEEAKSAVAEQVSRLRPELQRVSGLAQAIRDEAVKRAALEQRTQSLPSAAALVALGDRVTSLEQALKDTAWTLNYDFSRGFDPKMKGDGVVVGYHQKLEAHAAALSQKLAKK